MNASNVSGKISIWLPLVLWMAIIFYFSAAPTVPGVAEGVDISYLHLPVYFILAVLFLRLFMSGNYGRYGKQGFLLALVLSTAYGFGMEALQFFMPDRLLCPTDIFLNFAGSCFVFVFVPRFMRKPLLMKTNKTDKG